MELLFHISMIFTIMALSLTEMGRSSSFFRDFGGPRGGPMPPQTPDYPEVQEGEDRFLVNPLNVDVLSFRPSRPRGPQGSSSFPWSPRSQFRMPQQSPIDINTCRCKTFSNNRPLRITYAESARADGIVVEISNSGHGATLRVPEFEARPILSGGMLPNPFHFDNLHCHWGKDDLMGSEHFINGEAYAMECHLVTYNSKYKDINDALNNCIKKDQDSVAVYTFFYKLAKEDNKKLESFLSHIPKIRESGSKVNVADQNAFLWFLEPIPSNTEYYAYPGSLTTPEYTPCVTFFLLPVPVGVSRRQLATLRTLMDDHTPSKPVGSNRREIQILNHRPVYCVKPPMQATAKEFRPNDVDYYYWDRDRGYPVIRYGK